MPPDEVKLQAALRTAEKALSLLSEQPNCSSILQPGDPSLCQADPCRCLLAEQALDEIRKLREASVVTPQEEV